MSQSFGNYSSEQDVLEAVTARAAVDADYRGRLLAEPRAAVQELTGLTLPDTFNIRFIEKDPGVDALVVLPDLIDGEPELSAEELEAVAGGLVEPDCWCISGDACGGQGTTKVDTK